MTRVLLICNDIVGENMAGPGIRYWEFARVLRRHCDVTLAVPPFIARRMPPTNVPWVRLCHTPRQLHALVTTGDVIVTLGVVPLLYPFVVQAGRPLVIDLYDPFLLEDLQRQAHLDLPVRLTSHEHYLEALRLQIRAGDFFLCAGEKQRDYWLGMLSALGRVNPYTYRDDPSLRRLIDVVPFGLPDAPPRHTRSVLKGVHEAVRPNDKVLLWGGGIWEWFDALTLIRAMPRVLARRDDVKLFFMGIKRSGQGRAGAVAVERALALSRESGLYGSHILFNDWVPYAERQNYLLEADVGVSLHLEHVESRFAFRTRLLDYLWAGLPIVSTAGDVLGERLAAQGLAHLVEPGDVEGVTRAILEMLDSSVGWRERLKRVETITPRYRWEVVARPLVEFCVAPRRAPDREYLAMAGGGPVHRVRRALRLGGVRTLLSQIRDYARWKVGRR